MINTTTLSFLRKLKKNNDRDWFAKHKDEYLAAHENLIAFADALLHEMNKHDNIETPSGKKSLHRIYRDVRFSKDKTAYNTHLSGGFKRATKYLRGGYYFRIEPGASFIAAGFWGPEPEDLKSIREGIASNEKEFRAILNHKNFKSLFELEGEQTTNAPRGFEKDHPALDLIRYKQFIPVRHFTDKEVLAPGFLKEVNASFKKLRPFLDFMSEVLTTDANGVSKI